MRCRPTPSVYDSLTHWKTCKQLKILRGVDSRMSSSAPFLGFLDALVAALFSDCA